ncbi:3-methylcrotonyl CoA carboxylase [Salpingoeca rosetta]|uniref:3-methylcrotonyl CoA carboxylase n=1 Tax=Salpingoeca rosetta (strain ATCC 50818 / BSB-021) TaxID=946362 RepID=F2UJ36_SALR5|nr:3-methylcrotonyl CoA carboxylase [Salpingoeca rosetta]EGD76984.1 3-methylcrotonyl CoA carboxylase [Salpingoeca rosetta]|eukprot:XP_004990824.1 3-methylcrotonyl CoA carboxylase [Salpingoeca rosetta]
MADEAYWIGAAPSSQSYLQQQKIIDVAKKSGAQGIHPGYGFLSENSDFANLCEQEGITFIGPPASAILSMGSKSESKEIMEPSGVPIVKGYHGENQDPSFLLDQARDIGFPVLIKAVKGGGGKGMRVVMQEKDFMENLEMAKGESRKHFSDDRVLIEKYVQRPRHVEVQVFADKYGNAVYLFERDCSLQRRHQKIIEEAPAPGLSPELRKELGEAAVRAALAVGYVGAGTVEFIMDTTTHEFFFMEMNTRLQVEHPVTEMVTNTDLVEWQLLVASGYELPATQDEIQLRGHSFEARIYAENPDSNFLPGSGPLSYLRTPAEAHDVRVETGVREKDEVSIHYDPMIAKLVVWGADRSQALNKLRTELGNYTIAGLPTNINFLQACAGHPEFAAANITTDFIDDHKSVLLRAADTETAVPNDVFAKAVAAIMHAKTLAARTNDSPWDGLQHFRLNSHHVENITLLAHGVEHTVNVECLPGDRYTLTLPNGTTMAVEDIRTSGDGSDESFIDVTIDGHRSRCNAALLDHDVHVFTEGNHFTFSQPRESYEMADSGADDPDKVAAPMTGTVVKVMVTPGQEVKEGDTLLVMEAMKMEVRLRRVTQLARGPVSDTRVSSSLFFI